MYTVEQHFLVNNDCYRNHKKLIPVGIMIHSTATPGILGPRWCTKWNVSGIRKCVHAFVDDAGVYQTLPWAYQAWHAGGKANRTHIGFELCEPKGIVYNHSGSKIIKYVPPEGYFDLLWSNAIELTAELCSAFNIDPMVAGCVLCHYEGALRGVASNHIDIKHWFRWENKTMDDFRFDVAAYLSAYCRDNP
jgi:N-acetylmuramoyl-L-alanine amidase